ncbi:MAG TPA: hypothetical protein VK469_06700, partial [Candidatus Kapabacteria bacterium]|nr:hypothetical protein [Candidatus Kapabacteria bacterium]
RKGFWTSQSFFLLEVWEVSESSYCRYSILIKVDFLACLGRVRDTTEKTSNNSLIFASKVRLL